MLGESEYIADVHTWVSEQGRVLVWAPTVLQQINALTREVVQTWEGVPEVQEARQWASDGESAFGVLGDFSSSQEIFLLPDDGEARSILVEEDEPQLHRPLYLSSVLVVPGNSAVHLVDLESDELNTLRIGRVTATGDGVILDGLVYVPEIIGGSITVVDPLQGRIVDRIRVTSQRLGGFARTDGRRVFVSLTDEEAVVAYDPATGDIERIQVEGDFPWYLWASEAAVVTYSWSDEVWTAIDARTGEEIDLIVCGDERRCPPHSVMPTANELFILNAEGLWLVPLGG